MSHQLQPFHQSNLVRLGYRLPESQRHDELLHRALIDRHLPFGCRWTEINGQRLLPLAKLLSPRLSRIPSAVRQRTAKLTRPLNRRRAAQPPLSLERVVVERTTSLLEADPLRKLITGEDSVGRRLFPLEELHRMIDGLACSHSALRLVLGSLLTAESFCQTMRETASLARRSITAGGATHIRSLVRRAS